MTETTPKDFIRQIIAEDAEGGREIVTRFPPEPNGFLHIGHAKSICLNFGVADEFDGKTFLRFDDTNPGKESPEYVDAIKRDVSWLGYDWKNRLTHASDYFEKLFDVANSLIKDGLAYVDSLSADEIREYRGTLTEAGRNSPYRDRSIAENLDLFGRMQDGEFVDGEHVLRAKIDMGAPNINLRDPTLYRIRRIAHQNVGERWNVYPMYDFAHALCDAFEGISHSLCTLEFEDHRPLYDWLVEQLSLSERPRQIEFSRLNLAYSLTSKRKLSELVESGVVSGWDDPRLATIAGMRRRGYPPAAIRDFIGRIGVTKKENIIEMGVLENSVRENLDHAAERRMAVIDPLKVVISNVPDDQREMLDAKNHPNRPELGSRQISFSREVYIERSDFMEDAPRKFFRLKPGGEVRLRFAYIIRCDEVIKDAAGNVIELRCSYDPETRSGGGSDRKVKGTIHWVNCADSIAAEVRLYDRLFNVPNPSAEEVLEDALNPESLKVAAARLEASLGKSGGVFQFERQGYFCTDIVDSAEDRPVFNRIVTLRDSWAKLEKAALAAK